MKQKLFPGIDPITESIVTEMTVEGISGSEWEFQITYNSNLPESNDQWFTVYLLDSASSAEKIGTTNRLSKAIEIVAKYTQIQIMDEDDSYERLLEEYGQDLDTNDDGESTDEDTELNAAIVEIVEKYHWPTIDEETEYPVDSE